MKALVLKGDGEIVLESIPESDIRPGFDHLVEVKYSGICGSDLPRAFHGKAYHYPLVMGHEFSGILRSVPPDSAFRAGDRVVVFPLLPCGMCGPCQTGDFAQCEDYDYFGSRRDGGFAELVAVPEKNLFRVPDRVDLSSAAMTEPCAVALHGVEKLSIRAGMSALVIGGGPIGLMVAQWLRVKGCGVIRVADVDGKKLEVAAALGFATVDSGKTDLVEETRSACSGAGAGIRGAGAPGTMGTGGKASDGYDCVVEACGLPRTFLQAIQCAGRFGQVVFMGNIQGDFRVPEKDFSQILRNELTIHGTWNSRIAPRGKDEWTRVLSFLDDAIDVQSLISHRPALSDGPEVFRRLSMREGWFNKVVFAL